MGPAQDGGAGGEVAAPQPPSEMTAGAEVSAATLLGSWSLLRFVFQDFDVVFGNSETPMGHRHGAMAAMGYGTLPDFSFLSHAQS